MTLDAILAHKRGEVAARKAGRSQESLLARCEPSRKSLSAALARGRPGFLLELKFASPSAGAIRSDADLDAVLQSYGRHADAVSVLTDQRFFGGSLERLAEVRRRLTQPLLCKDFVLDPYQVAEARAFGADAILLILAAVDDSAWHACASLATELGMDVLTEVHDAGEADRAVALGARLIGVNNRNLRDLSVDLGVTERIAPRLPADRLVVAESGIESRDTVLRLRSRVDAVLVGTALMRERDVDLAVRSLVYGRTKVCGLTNSADALAARNSGATHGGLIFAARSPRQVTVQQAERIRREVDLAWVGVFEDQPVELVAEVAASLQLSAVQLHGAESANAVSALRERLGPRSEIWKAVRLRDRVPSRGESGADRLLFDGPASSQRFDWQLLDQCSERDQVILAGGLNPDNAAVAAGLGTYALDVSSGVEASPGRKDAALLRRFFSARRVLPGRGSEP